MSYRSTSIMNEIFSRKLTGLSSEQMNIFCLKKSVECAAGYWNPMIIGEAAQQHSAVTSAALREKCVVATATFHNVVKSTEQQKDNTGTLQTFLSENVMIAYLHLILVFYNHEVLVGGNLNAENEHLSNDILWVAAACLKCMDSGDNYDRLVADFTEGTIFIIRIAMDALRLIFNSENNSCDEGFLINIIRFASIYVNTLSSMSRKYSNRKKLYTTFCTRLLANCVKMFQSLESTHIRALLSNRSLSVLDDFIHVLESLIEHSLFVEDKNVEDLAASGALIENFTVESTLPDSSTGAVKIDSVSFKASYHGGFFDALSATCSVISQNKEINLLTKKDSIGYPDGFARLLQLYTKCSNRILVASLVIEQNIDQRNSEVAVGGKVPSTLQERRKHTIRVLQMSLSLIATVDSTYQKQLAALFTGSNLKDEEDSLEESGVLGSVRCMVSCIETQRQVLQALSTSMDETGGSSILATHDSLQPLARRLHSLSKRSLVGASSPLQAFLPPNLTAKYTAVVMTSGDGVRDAVESMMLEARSLELDCVKILVGIDHRVITNSQADPSVKPRSHSKSSESHLSSSVLRAIANSGDVTAVSSASTAACASRNFSQLLNSKEQLLLSVITLFDDLRRMDDFVSEVRSVCCKSVVSVSSLFTLLSSRRVQETLARAFASLPSSQSELVWGALTAPNTTGASSSSSSSVSSCSRMDQRCQSMILRALVQATNLSPSSTPSRRQEGTSSSDDIPQSCDRILQLGALISLSTPLPVGIVEAMTILFCDTVLSLQQLEVDPRPVDVGNDDPQPVQFILDIASMLLQLGSAAIVLHRSKQADPKDQLWLRFRESAGATGTLQAVQRPISLQSVGDGGDCLSAAATLFSLSAFIATCDSLNLPVPKGVVSSTDRDDMEKQEDEEELTAQPSLTANEVDAFVLEMIVTSSHGSVKATNLTGGDTGGKRKRKEQETAESSSPCSVAAVDFLLIFCRSVSVWRHLHLEPSTISDLTVAHLRDMTRFHTDPRSSGDRALVLKHQCLCRVMQLVPVLDCPVLVNGFLLAVERAVKECSDALAVQPSETSTLKTRKSTKTSHVPVPVLALPLAAMSLLSMCFSDAAAGVYSMGLPVGDLLSASVAALGTGASTSQPFILVHISQYATSVIHELLLHGTEGSSSSSQILPWAAATSSLLTKGAINERQTALAAASSILHLCLQNRLSTLVRKVGTSLLAPPPAHSTTEAMNSWRTVDLQLHAILRPLLSALSSQGNSNAIACLQSLTPLVLDFLLQSSSADLSDSAEKEGNTHIVLNTLSAAIIDALEVPSNSGATLKIFVEIYRRVCSCYCSQTAEAVSASASSPIVEAAAQHLMSELLPRLQTSSGIDSIAFDSCCFLAADSIRLHTKYSEEQQEGKCDAFLATVSLPPLPVQGTDSDGYAALDGWFLLTGTILLLQRRSGNLLSVRGSFLLIEQVRQAVLLAAAIPATHCGAADVDTLMCQSVCLQGLVSCVPHSVHSEVGKMLVALAQRCACSSSSTDSMTTGCGPSISPAALSRYVVLGVDSLLSNTGHYSNETSPSEAGGSLASARAVLESVAVSCTSSEQMLSQPEVVLAVISALRRGITTIQQQQQKGRRKTRRIGARGVGSGQEQVQDLTNTDQDEESFKGREHTLSQWASSCFSILSKIVPRLLKGNGGFGGGSSSDAATDGIDFSNRARVEISAHALSVLEQLFACDSVGGSSLPLLGNSIGALGALLTTAIRVILSAGEALTDEKRHTSAVHADTLTITNALRVAGRTLTAASSSKELNRHSHVLAASLVDLLAQRPLTTSTRELLLPGLFALFDRCRQKQRLQMFATVSAQTRAVLSDLHGTYLRDFKFTGQ